MLKVVSIGLACGLLTLIVGSNRWSNRIVVSSLVIEGNVVVEKATITKLSGVTPGAFIEKANLHSIRENILADTFIEDAVVTREYPSTINIRVRERVPIAILNADLNLYIDREGIVITHGIDPRIIDLPVISGIPATVTIKPGQRIAMDVIGPSLQLLLTAKSMGSEFYHLISEVQIRGDGDLVIYSSEGGIPILFGKGDTIDKLINLEALWTEAVRTRDPRKLQYIDLRFEHQVVVRWNQELL
jgi:cell division protein FtsQ